MQQLYFNFKKLDFQPTTKGSTPCWSGHYSASKGSKLWPALGLVKSDAPDFKNSMSSRWYIFSSSQNTGARDLGSLFQILIPFRKISCHLQRQDRSDNYNLLIWLLSEQKYYGFHVYYSTRTQIWPHFSYSKLKNTNGVESLAATLGEACRHALPPPPPPSTHTTSFTRAETVL